MPSSSWHLPKIVYEKSPEIPLEKAAQVAKAAFGL
jgi:hypothetical protein